MTIRQTLIFQRKRGTEHLWHAPFEGLDILNQNQRFVPSSSYLVLKSSRSLKSPLNSLSFLGDGNRWPLKEGILKSLGLPSNIMSTDVYLLDTIYNGISIPLQLTFGT